MADLNSTEYVIFLENINNILCLVSDNYEKINKLLYLAIDFTSSEGGTIYFVEEFENERKLKITFAKNKSINFEFFVGHTIPINKISIAGFSALTGEIIVINNIEEIPRNHPYSQFSFFDKTLNYKTNNTIVIPIKDSNNNTVGVFQLVNKISREAQYNQSDINASVLLANLIATIIEKDRLKQNYQNNIENLHKLLSSMFDWMKFTVNKINETMIMSQGKFIEYSHPKANKTLPIDEGIYILDKQIQLSYITFAPFVICMIDFGFFEDLYLNKILELFDKETRRQDIIIINQKAVTLIFFNTSINSIDSILRRYRKVTLEFLKQYDLKNIDIKYGFVQFDPYIPNQDAKTLLEETKKRIKLDFFL